MPNPTLSRGWRPGLLGRAIALHATHYASQHGFGLAFEAVVASGLAGFAPRLGNPRNALWYAHEGETILGTIAIDAEDMAPAAHLRWFILDEAARGRGLGRALLAEALAFCDAEGFPETRLWTFAGLDAARHLYEAAGFRLAREARGDQWGVEVLEQEFRRPRSGGA